MKLRAVLITALMLGTVFSAVLYTRATQSVGSENPIAPPTPAHKPSPAIKQLIERIKEEVERDSDRFPACIQEVENEIKKSTDQATTALLHSMLAEMYHHYYLLNQWQFNARTPLAGYIPDDINEWTSNLYTTKIAAEIEASLQPAEVLQQTPALAFKEIIEEGADSQQLYPSLFDLLANRAIEIDPTEALYQQLLGFRRSEPDKKALLLVELSYFQYLAEKEYGIQQQEQYEKSLDSLLSLHADKEYAVEIIAAKLRILQNKSYRPESSDSIKALQYRLCQETIRRFPHYERIGIIHNELQTMEEPRIAVVTNNTVYPGDSLQIKIKSTNIAQIVVSLYASTKTTAQTLPRYAKAQEEHKTPGQPIKQYLFSLAPNNKYTEQESTYSIPIEAYGLYTCVITVPQTDITTTALFSVSRLAALSRQTRSGAVEVFVTDYKTGKPMADATVHYYGGKRDKPERLGSVGTDKEGIAQLPQRADLYAYQASRAADSSAILTPVYTSHTTTLPTEERTQISLFTDRGIYRPGQTIFFKGIATQQQEEKAAVVANKTVRVTLRDANEKEISSKEFRSNNYGSFSGSFTLPKNRLNGLFSLSTDQGVAYVQVEEYKRPTFSLTLQPLQGEVAFGDSLTITGEARTFSGVALAQGELSYRIIRRPFFYRSYNARSEEQVAEGKAGLSGGRFTIPFCPQKEEKGSMPIAYQRYEVITLLTDSKGETQEGRMSFAVGERSVVLQSNLTEKANKDHLALQVVATSLNGDTLQKNVTYTLWLADPDTPSHNNPKAEKRIQQGTVESGRPTAKGLFAQCPSGRYRLELKASDQKGREVTQSDEIVLYSLKDKRPPVYAHTWMVAEKSSCLPGETVEILFGTSDTQAHVLYELFSDGDCLSRTLIRLDNENKTFKLPFLNHYKKALTLSFTFVKEGKAYTQQTVVAREIAEKTVTIQPQTFRNHLLPGEREEWKLKVLNRDSVPLSAEVLASMYDASLDELTDFVWGFNPIQRQSLYQEAFRESAGLATSSAYDTHPAPSIEIPAYQYNKLNWQGVMERVWGGRYTRTHGGYGVMRMKSNAPSTTESADRADEPLESRIEEKPRSAATVRTNFNETAFFYPLLQTDTNGCLNIHFQVPESNTTWKLQMLAHTADLQYGMLTDQVVSSKPLMVLPSLPRFMRIADRVQISSQVINRLAKEISGTVSLELFDPATDQPIVCLTKAQKPFTLPKDSTTTVSWEITVPQHEGVIGCRIIAHSDAGSDGEQHLIPIVSPEILLTEATPFYLNRHNTRQIPINEAASATSRLHQITLEVSGNPVWYAVQALPTLDLPDNENVISWFASYYTNTLAQAIVATDPRLKNMIGRWMQEGETPTTLLSNLEQNEELKNSLLQETPWVMEAQSESEQKQRLTLLFDTNRAEQQREQALQTLLKRQDASGGWAWFDGFYPSRSITLFVLRGMSQLIEMNAVQYEQTEREMQIRALHYLDESIRKEYEQLKKNNGNNQRYIPSSEQIDYLFVRSAYRDIPQPRETHEAYRYYRAQAEKNWDKRSLHDKGTIALLLHQDGAKAQAKEILTRLRKTATVSAEQGMYWANNRAANNAFSSPVETHAFLMSVFKTLGAPNDEIDHLKQWLLTAKRTQQWESTPATMHAVYALLLTGTDWLGESNTFTVSRGKQLVSDSHDRTMAPGYLKKVLKAEQPADTLPLTITKEGNSPLWGAVYHQYFESIGAIKQQQGALGINKQLFVETTAEAGRQITPLTHERPLAVGDKVVVRLTIRADRAFDYVSIKDLRAGCFEPADQLSGATYSGGVTYYRSPKDGSENFFIAHLPTGTYVLEYATYVSRAGHYSGGIATIQCMYAPEFVSHTEGSALNIR